MGTWLPPRHASSNSVVSAPDEIPWIEIVALPVPNWSRLGSAHHNAEPVVAVAAKSSAATAALNISGYQATNLVRRYPGSRCTNKGFVRAAMNTSRRPLALSSSLRSTSKRTGVRWHWLHSLALACIASPAPGRHNGNPSSSARRITAGLRFTSWDAESHDGIVHTSHSDIIQRPRLRRGDR